MTAAAPRSLAPLRPRLPVADAPLTAGTVTAGGGVEGVTATTLSATFTDANPGATTSDFSGTIDWGDGNTTTFTASGVTGSNGAFTVNGSHTYAEEGTYTPVVTIDDAGGSTATDTGTTTVADAALTASGHDYQRHRGRVDRPDDGCDLHRRQSGRPHGRLHGDDRLGRRHARPRPGTVSDNSGT